MKVKDVVIITDGSYSKVLESDSKLLKNGIGIYLIGRKFTVIAIDGNFPSTDLSSPFCSINKNDLMLRAQDNGEIVFICSRFTTLYQQPAVKECKCCCHKCINYQC